MGLLLYLTELPRIDLKERGIAADKMQWIRYFSRCQAHLLKFMK